MKGWGVDILISMVFYSHFFSEELEVSVCCVLALSLVAVEL